MTDYSKCSGEGCAVKDFCHRFRAPAGTWQSYIDPPGQDEYCDWYMAEGKGAPSPEISDTVFRALKILRDARALMPRDFAHKMWPDSEGWDRQSKCGPKGAHRGGGMYLAAGGFLGRLCKRGLADRRYDRHRRQTYVITAKGRRALRYTVENRQDLE